MMNRLTAFSNTIGVGLVIASDGSMSLSLCQVSRSNSSLTLEKKIAGLNEINDLIKHIPSKSVISLNITGKGVLYKQIEKIDPVTPSNFGQILPNANFEDFYIQNFVSGEYSFIAVMRKAEADKLLDQFRDVGLTPVMLSLGPFIVNHVLPQLNLYANEVAFDGHIIVQDGQKQWSKYTYGTAYTSSFPLKIENEPIDELLVLAYASAFQLMMAEQLDVISPDIETVNHGYNNAVSVKRVKSYGAVILVGLFILLLANFILFSYYQSENTGLAYQVSRSSQNVSQIKDAADRIKGKEQQLQYLGWDGGISKAQLTDQLAAEMPADITWKQVEINPIDVNSSRTQRTLIFKDRQITITGVSQKILPVNEWMARIKSKRWVKGVQLQNYSFNNELNTGQFIVNITY
ncbi:hypothetical protein KXQ82_10455 [Mucilaginibacter sp. HMF5004]|uniref:hypothetical protein n=1 Tax=Mucilaginibacter rivuli TaxID=2857527 RepID=UPI001C5D8429|nr:hypothetical protein [Mucilaginibacter rivuli]MBW4890140.1 hypothetical protein [Mucilaginibacter rivuli]